MPSYSRHSCQWWACSAQHRVMLSLQPAASRFFILAPSGPCERQLRCTERPLLASQPHIPAPDRAPSSQQARPPRLPPSSPNERTCAYATHLYCMIYILYRRWLCLSPKCQHGGRLAGGALRACAAGAGGRARAWWSAAGPLIFRLARVRRVRLCRGRRRGGVAAMVQAFSSGLGGAPGRARRGLGDAPSRGDQLRGR